MVATAVGAFSACGGLDEPAGPDEELDRVGQAASACWDPAFGTKGCSQSDWWLEFSVKDSTTKAMQVEISGTPSSRTVDLAGPVPAGGAYVKFTGGPGNVPVPAGTLIRLSATQSAAGGGKTARSAWFAYRKAAPVVDCQTCTPSCAANTCGSDGCSGKCACPTGAVCLSSLSCCQPNNNTCGPDGCGGTHGACPCTPACSGRQCGDDGCGGICGTCGSGTVCSSGACVAGCVAPWNPLWQQNSSSGSWWAEYQVVGGSVPTSVSLQVIGGGSYALTYGYGLWTGGLDGVPSGTSVVLHATDATGASAQTVPFRFLVDTVPVTDPCKGTPSKSPTCLPLTRGMVTFSMDDSLETQRTLAAPVLAKYGYKATLYYITSQLQNYGLVPYAQAMAAAGHEVGDHTVTHPDLTTVTAAHLDDELRLSQQYLLANVGSPVSSFASPMGDYNATVLAAVKKYFTSHRTVNPGLNYVGTSVWELNADGVYNTSAPADVCAMLAQAATYRGWRILVFHDFTTAASSSMSLQYPVAGFESILKCAQTTPGLDVVTTRQGVAAIACASP